MEVKKDMSDGGRFGFGITRKNKMLGAKLAGHLVERSNKHPQNGCKIN